MTKIIISSVQLRKTPKPNLAKQAKANLAVS